MTSDKGTITGTITLNSQQDEQYAGINWRHKSNRVLVIHRLAVLPVAQGNGLGRLLCEFAETFARENGFDCIRLDAYQGNPVSGLLYSCLGYLQADGVCWFHGNELPFLCWEKPVREG